MASTRPRRLNARLPPLPPPFFLLAPQALPFSQRLFELAILSEPAVVTATTVLAPAAVLWTQAQSPKRFGLGF